MKRVARVSLSGQLVGYLEEEEGTTSFAYTSDWLARADAQPVSLTLPLQAAPYTHRGLHPFFENLLPEGWLFDIASRKLQISKDDAFGMLMATCGDCVGSVEIEPASRDEALR
jgi:serine/threonine-protein kinase HipA